MKYGEQCPGPHYHLYACTGLDLVILFYVSGCLSERKNMNHMLTWCQMRSEEEVRFPGRAVSVSHRVSAGT